MLTPPLCRCLAVISLPRTPKASTQNHQFISLVLAPSPGYAMIDRFVCEFTGNSDIYGLGVRLGTYIQWLSAIIALNLSREEAESMLSMVVCYQFAMLTGTIWITQHHTSLALESIIAILFCFGGVCVSSTQEFSVTKLSALQQTSLFLQAAVVGYGTWLVFYGLDELNRTPWECPEKAFFFCPAPLFGWYRTILKVVFVCSACALAIWLLLVVAWLCRSCFVWLETWEDESEPEAESSDLTTNQRSLLSRSLAVGVLGLAIFVASIELTLHWNNVRGVYSLASFSQLFPLVIGASSFARLVYKVGSAVWKGDLRFACS